MLSPLHDASPPELARLRLVDDIDTEAPGWLVDQDEAAAMAAELDRLASRMRAVKQRLERLGAALAAALDDTGRESALAGAVA